MRKTLQSRRSLTRQKFSIYTPDPQIEGQTNRIVLYVDVGQEDGQPCEVFIVVRKDGTMERALFTALARTISVALQSGTRLEDLVNLYLGQRFLPAGTVTGHPRIKMCSSVLDLVGRYLAVEYLGWEDEAHVKKETPCVDATASPGESGSNPSTAEEEAKAQ